MPSSVVKRIEEHPFFAEWTLADMTPMIRASEELLFGEGDVIVEFGDERFGCYFLLDGEVSILAPMDGRMTEVDRRCAGEIFGEVSMLTREPFFVRVVACCACRIAFISQSAINSYVGSIPGPLAKLLRSLVRHLGRSNVTFAERTRQQEKMAIVGSVVKDVVNDFNSPVEMINLGAEAINRLSGDKQVHNICSSITEQVKKILELSAELSVFARSESEFRYQMVRLPAFMEDFRKENEAYFRNRDLHINIDVPDIEFEVEPVGMHKAFNNLLRHSVFMMGEGRGHISISAMLKSEDTLEIVFIDDGMGIPNELQKNFWEPFITCEAGLSMSVVKGVVESHGGEIAFSSVEGSGTTFIITLPRFHVTAA